MNYWLVGEGGQKETATRGEAKLGTSTEGI